MDKGYLILERTFCKLITKLKFLIVCHEITRDFFLPSKSELQDFLAKMITRLWCPALKSQIAAGPHVSFNSLKYFCY